MPILYLKCQRTKKVVSDSRGLVDFAVGVMNIESFTTQL